jgi:hypothetical protein
MFRIQYKNTNRREDFVTMEDDHIAHGLINIKNLENQTIYDNLHPSIYKFASTDDSDSIIVHYDDNDESYKNVMLIDRIKHLDKLINKNTNSK